MKLQYYLRGLGIGILVTAMIFCILPGEKEVLTDEEIRARAVQLGMVESSSLTLADIQKQQESTKEQEAQAQPTETQEESVSQPEPTITPESEEMVQTSEATETVQEPEGAAEVLKITINSGSGSYTVSKMLEENLLIDNAEEFDKYLISNGYSRKIRVGTHEIPTDATWEEIADIISGK